MQTGIIIQARTSSTRLPDKVLKPLPFSSDISILQQVIRRSKLIPGVNEVVIATTEDEADNAIVQIAKKEGVKVFRGSKENVLERYYLAAQEFSLHHIIRITSDCPCIDPEVTGKVLDLHLKENADYTSNSMLRKYPHGLDSEVFTFGALEKAYHGAIEPFEKEHVTIYFYRTKPSEFKVVSVEAPPEHSAPHIRVTVDTIEDYLLLCAVYDYLYDHSSYFGVRELINLFKAKPWLELFNQKITQKKVFNNLDEEVKESLLVLEKQDLNRAKEYFQRTYEQQFKS